MKNIVLTLIFVFVFKTNLSFGSEAGMPQLNSEFWAAQIFWLFVLFAILYIVIWKSILPKIVDGIENRKKKITSDLDEAQKFKNDAEKKLIEYKKIIEQSKKEAKKIIEDSKKKLETDIKSKKQKFNDEIEEELKVVEKEIKDLKKSSISNINNIAAETSAEVIKQIIDTEVNRSNVSAVVEDIVKREIEKHI